MIAAVISLLTASAQTEAPDTIKVIENVRQIKVTTSKDNTIITAVTPNDDGTYSEYQYDVTVEQEDKTIGKSDRSHFGFPFRFETDASCGRSNKVLRSVTGLKGLYWGWNFNYHDKGDIKNCFEVGIMELVGISWQRSRRGPAFDIGLGFGMRRYLTGNGAIFARDGQTLSFIPSAEHEGIKLTRSRMDIWTFHLPLTYTQPLGRHFNFAAGAIVNFNTYAKAWNRWESGETKVSETIKGFEQRLLTADIFASINLRDALGFYARWSPVPVFCSDKGPSVRSWSIGAVIGF